MKQKTLLRSLLLLCALIVGIGSAWGETSYTITFNDTGTDSDSSAKIATIEDIINEGASYVSSITDVSNVYKGRSGRGLKLGTSSKTGSLTLNLTTAVTPTKITFKARQYNGTETSITVNDQAEAELTTNFDEYTINYDGNTEVSAIAISTPEKRAYITEVTVYYEEGGSTSTLTDSDFALTNDPIALTFDLYNNATAQVINYTTSSTGAVTVANSDYISAEVGDGTITITPLKKTNGAVEITVNQAADDDYKAGSATFTVTITDSTPKTGGWVLANLADLTEDDVFVIVGNNGSDYAMNNEVSSSNPPSAVAVTIEGDEITSDVADNIKWNISGDATDGYTFYPDGDTENWLYCTNTNNGVRVGTNDNSTFVISTEGYLMHSGTSRYVGIYNSQDWRCYTSINSNIKDQTFAFYKYVDNSGVQTPSITASNVSIDYDATTGEIDYTLKNAVTGGSLNASVTAGDWLTIGTIGETISFTCSANTEATARTATVMLTYTYGDNETVTKDVTVTQAGNPNVVDNISDITEVGTAYKVRGTVVATNARGLVIGDGTGYVYYYKNAAPAQAVGDMVTISGTTGTYGHIIQFTNSATVAEANASNYDNTPEAEVITEVPDYSEGYHLSTYLEFEGELSTTSNNYFITLGDAQIQVSYPTTAQGNTLSSLDGKNVHVKGYFSGINSSSKFSVMLESVEEVASTEPSITVSPTTIEAPADGAEGSLSIDWENIDDPIFDIIFTDESGEELEGDDPDWINVAIEENDGDFFVNYVIDNNEGEARTAYMKVYTFVGDKLDEVYSDLITIIQDEQTEPVADYIRILSLDQLTDGSKVIIAARNTEEDATIYYAMKNSTSGKPYGDMFNSIATYTGVEGFPGELANDYYWTVNVTENGYTFTNADGQMLGYRSSTNFAQDSNTDWTIERSTSEESAMVGNYMGFVIKNYSTINATTTRGIAFNGSAFGAYATSNMNGSEYNFFLDLFVQDAPAPVATITLNDACTDGEMVYGTYSNSNAFVVSGEIIVSEIGIDANGKLVVEPYETGDVVPANTGVMVSAFEGGEYTVDLSYETGTSVLGTDNCLRPSGDAGITANEMAAADANSLFYRLTMHNGETLGFWWGAAEGAAFALAANKAYLTVPVNAARPGFVLGGETTAISGMKSEVNENAPVYNMQGQRVAQPAKGLYIVNGKKYINK